MFDIANGHQTLLQNKNYYIKKNYNFHVCCYVGNWNVTRGVAIELYKF